MKKIVMTALLSIFSAPALAETIHVNVDGLVCAFCAKGIENSFAKHESVSQISVDLDNKLVTLTTKEGATLDDAAIKEAITAAGYTVNNIHHQK